MKKLFSALTTFWGGLPHQLQAILVAFAAAALGTLSKEFEALLSGSQAFTWLTLRHDIASALAEGIIAARAFYMLPSPSVPKDAK